MASKRTSARTIGGIAAAIVVFAGFAAVSGAGLLDGLVEKR